MKKYKLTEIYNSVKGEGTQAGVPMVFVRFSHCNLDCSWCDTPYKRVAIELTVDGIVQAVGQYKPAWIIFTGGEPCLQLDLNLVEAIQRWCSADGYKVRFAIETNGTVYTDALRLMDYINISPKTGHPINPKIVEAVNAGTIKVSEVRYTLSEGQDDLWDVGFKPEVITISPLMHDPVDLPANWKSGMGHPSVSGIVDQVSLNKCLSLVQKYRQQGARLSVQVHKFIGER